MVELEKLQTVRRFMAVKIVDLCQDSLPLPSQNATTLKQLSDCFPFLVTFLVVSIIFTEMYMNLMRINVYCKAYCIIPL